MQIFSANSGGVYRFILQGLIFVSILTSNKSMIFVTGNHVNNTKESIKWKRIKIIRS